jgi:hypothetical protein
MKRSKVITGIAAQIEDGTKRLNELGKKLGEAGIGEQYDALDREITGLLWRYFGANEEAQKIAREDRKIRRAVAKVEKPAKRRSKALTRGPCAACGKPVGLDDACRNPRCTIGALLGAR